MAKHYTDNYLHHLKHEPFVEWDNAKKRYVIDLDGDINPDPKIYRDGKNKPWAESGRRGRGKIMEQFVKARVSQHEGKPAFSAELKEHKEYKHTQNVDTPWIQIRKDGTCYVNLFDANLVPTKSDVASVDEIRKWGESSLEEKEKIVDGVLKALKIRRLNRECTRKGRKEKRYKKTTKKKSAAAAAAAASTAPVAAAVSSSSTTQSSEPNVTHNHHHHHHHHHHNTTNINTQGNGKVNINV